MWKYIVMLTVEAVHIANQLCQYGYFFPVNDSKTLTVRDDSSLYRFQVPYLSYYMLQNRVSFELGFIMRHIYVVYIYLYAIHVYIVFNICEMRCRSNFFNKSFWISAFVCRVPRWKRLIIYYYTDKNPTYRFRWFSNMLSVSRFWTIFFCTWYNPRSL